MGPSIRLKIKKKHSAVSVSGIGEVQSGQTLGEVRMVLQSCHSSYRIPLTAYVLRNLTSSIPSFSPEHLGWSHLRHLQLADPEFAKPGPIDILIGADSYGDLIEPDIRRGDPHTPVAQKTRLGWVVLGPTDRPNPSPVFSAHLKVSNSDLQDLLSKFWVLEEVPVPSESIRGPEEEECERHFRQTHLRDNSGRYVVRLPFQESPTLLGESRPMAQACLHRLLKRYSTGKTKDEEFLRRYTEFLKEYESLGHMVRAPVLGGSHGGIEDLDFGCQLDRMTLAPGAKATGGSRVLEGGQSFQDPERCASHELSGRYQANHRTTYYFPHHGVIKESSETTKLRVVFNGSAKTSSGKSLNDIMHTGPKLQRDVSGVLLWSRQHKLIFMTDITKMFRQIRVHHEDWPMQQILWKDTEGNIITYQLTTVTYGTRCAPFLAVRVLDQLVEDEGHRFPLAVLPLTKGRYVDDICGGAELAEDLYETAQQVKEMCLAGGFPLAKWHSNCQNFLKSLSTDEIDEDQHSYEDAEARILGISWKPPSDQFVFSVKPVDSAVVTKRTVTSEIAQLFDPLGFLSPVIIRSKVLLQGLWVEKVGWDDPLTPALCHKWNQFRADLVNLKEISIPRWLGLTSKSRVELHGFSDASQLAMAAVIYLRIVNEEGIQVSIVCSKTKVAPLKRLTIPRLELAAALLLAQLTGYVQSQLNLSNVPVFLWTDSAVTLAWVSSHPSRWKEFVRNRVSSIQAAVPLAQWRFIAGKENPADCASRGLSAEQLKVHELWWTGPPWLVKDSSEWPRGSAALDSGINLEEKPGVLLTAQSQRPKFEGFIERYSSYKKLLKHTAVLQRFIEWIKNKKVSNTCLSAPLGPDDLNKARLYWVKTTQASYFAGDLKVISRGEHLGKSNPMTKLVVFIDNQGILRVGGRLQHAKIDPESKHQVILPKESHLTYLVIKDAHERTLHGGTQLTLAYLRCTYWILGGRTTVRSFILKCVRCARSRGERAQQLMGQLPAARITPTRAFLNSGVDYAGPVTLKSWKGRSGKPYKGWLAIFVCLATSAVHLEIVTDYTTDGFIAAYRRFISRRGICSRLYSDCGTNFQGADKELKRLFATGSKDNRNLAHLLANDGTQWSFNPPGAPHFGGKWEAAVKSVKHHLHRTIGDSSLTYEELITLLTQIEAVLNSRPLEPLTDDPDDLAALTPGHFLIGEAPTTVPEPSLEHLKVGRLSRWQLIQHKLQQFWKHWSMGYLQRQQAISKWFHPSNDIKIGSMVLLSDERYPPSKWPLARVIALRPGADGLVRVVTVRTMTTIKDQPVAKLATLPVAKLATLPVPIDEGLRT